MNAKKLISSFSTYLSSAANRTYESMRPDPVTKSASYSLNAMGSDLKAVSTEGHNLVADSGKLSTQLLALGAKGLVGWMASATCAGYVVAVKVGAGIGAAVFSSAATGAIAYAADVAFAALVNHPTAFMLTFPVALILSEPQEVIDTFSTTLNVAKGAAKMAGHSVSAAANAAEVVVNLTYKVIDTASGKEIPEYAKDLESSNSLSFAEESSDLEDEDDFSVLTKTTEGASHMHIFPKGMTLAGNHYIEDSAAPAD